MSDQKPPAERPGNVALQNPLVKKNDIARFLNVRPTTIANWTKNGKIPFVKVVGSYRYDLAAVIQSLK
jgi:hypothetical protein